MKENQTPQYYRIKSEYYKENNDGGIGKTKMEELVYATTYGEVEELVYTLADQDGRTEFGEMKYDISKTNISTVFYNQTLTSDTSLTNGLIRAFFEESEDTGVGLYSVKVVFTDTDDKTGKEKRSTETYYVPAASNVEATGAVNKLLSNSVRNYVIRDTKFDRAEAIYWPQEIYREKTTNTQI